MVRKTAAKKSATPRKAPKTRPDENPASPSPPPPGSFPIVGVGASAGGLEAFTALLKGIPPRTGMAFVLVQHLAPKHESILGSLLARTTEMPVLEAEEGTKVEPDHVYVIPPARDLVLRDGRLGLTPRPERVDGAHMPIDLFLRTLAEAHDDLAVGVILSGTGTDGTLGIRAIKQAGGIVIAQEPESARYDGMPRSAIVSGEVDYVLPPQGIGAELVRLASLPAPLRVAPPAPQPEDEDPFHAVLGLVRRTTGTDFSSYRKTTLLRRLRRRMVVRKVETLAEYLGLLEGDSDELQALHQDLLINVTSFFRDPDTFALLAEKVFPEILTGRPADLPVRIWVPGCSTGEEVYSLAISLLESRERARRSIRSSRCSAPTSARSRSNAPAPAPSSRTSRRTFRPSGCSVSSPAVDGHFQVNKSVRDLCIFARQDVTRDPPFSRLDLVSCRNLLIYLEPSLQRRVISAFHYSLMRGSYLLLGGSETIGSANDLFRVVDRERKLYSRKAAVPARLHEILAPRIVRTQVPEAARALPVPAPAAARIELQREGQRLLLARYGPPSVLVDANFDALEFRGELEPFLRHKPGDATLNLPKLVRQGLLAEVRQVLQEAKRSNAAARRDGIRFQQGKSSRPLSVQALPIKVSGGGESGFLVVFELSGKPPTAPPEPRPKSPRKRDRMISDLEEELAATRNHLQATIEEQEASNEELQSANEEILSSTRSYRASTKSSKPPRKSSSRATRS